MQAIKAYELSHGIPFEEMPSNFAFFGDDETLDLRPWSMIVSDKTMHTIASVCRIYQDCSLRALQLPPEQAQGLLKPSLRTLLVTKTGKVTDTGLKAVVDSCHTLVHLDLSHVACVSDVGIREVAIACASTLHVFKLSGNSHLRGDGLAVVGDCCSVLKELHLSRCTGLKEWALSKLWHGCGRLMVVNLSHCAQVGDQCIREMAAGCPLLRHVDLEEVQQVSDVGVLAISHHCRGLETLSLSRTNLLFKITDVAMLALGERCPMLQELKLANCNCVTDVGLNWLALGCVALRYLDLSGCTKVGNPGLRALSEHCHALEVLNLKDARLCTDVGVKHLSQGCTNLTSLNLSGMYLISDGVKRDFGAEGLAALSQGCSKLKHLHLNGCFRVSKLALKAMGKGLAELEKISLAFCTSLTDVGLADLFRGCRALLHVDLTECGSCVTDKAVVELAQHCHMLKSLLLRACDRLSGVSIKALARHCKAIETLDLSGCVGIDDLAILPLTEADFKPGLKCLNIDGCVKVTDTGLAWLADACPSIITLSCKGSGVSVRALQAVREAWCWSSVRKTEEELGVFPFSRLADRRFIHHHATQYRAATTITALVRGYLGRLRCDRLRLDRHKAWVATVVQSLVRRCMAIKLVTRLRREAMRKHLCATAVQCMYRCWKARRRVDERRAEALHILRTKAATEIQRVWRGILGKRRAKRIREQARILRAKQQSAAIHIQRVYKGFLARRVVRDLRIRRTKERQRRLRATLLLQRVVRGHFSRLRTCRLRADRDRMARLRLSCAVKLERTYRGHLGRRRVATLRRQQANKQRVVLWVQKHWRGYAARQEFESLLQHLQLEGEERAAVVMQKYWRRGLAYLELRRLLQQRSQRHALMGNRAYFIQRVYRGYCARKRVRMLLAEKARWKELGAKLELRSAIRIQACIRRFHAQSRFRRLKTERKGRWKELLDEKSGRKFYYNKVSGEVRWRTPQDVLDLQPRPGCGDCNVFEAAMECAHCAEFFCNGCWKRVHQGGKRAAHEFRVIYDYYHKRIDYGEGEFPSRWPSDMHQDELNGWKLRVYPSRQPTALLEGEWEEYRDEMDPEGGRPLYYNRMTGASTYDPPASTQPKQQQAANLPFADSQLTTYSQPNGWLEYFDQANNLPYWYDPSTNSSTYSRPLELQLTPPAALEYGESAASFYTAPSAAAGIGGTAESQSWGQLHQNEYY